MANSTEQLQTTTNLVRTHVDLMPLAGVGGYAQEPALSLCNDTLQELLAYPYAWKFNRQEMSMLVTYPNRQDYLFAGAVAFTLGSNSRGAGIGLASASAITETSFTVSVTTLEPHGFSVGNTVYMTGNTVSSYNSSFAQDENTSNWTGGWAILTIPTPTSFTFTHATSGLAVSGAPGITDFGWAESATLVEMNNFSSPQNIKVIRAVTELQPTWRAYNPEKVCVLKDYGTGVLKIRFADVPSSTIWGLNLVYQSKAPYKNDLANNWAPFPDEFGFVYRQMFMARCYRYLNSAKEPLEYQKAQQLILKALGRGDAEAGETHIVPYCSLLEW